MHVAGIFVFSFLLAVSIDVPSTYGASITRDLEHDSVKIFRRQGSFGPYINAGSDGTWDAGVKAGYKTGNTDLNAKFGIDQTGKWGANVGASHTFSNGIGLNGNVGLSQGGNPSFGVGVTIPLGK